MKISAIIVATKGCRTENNFFHKCLRAIDVDFCEYCDIRYYIR